LALGQIFAIGIFCTFSSRLPVGLALDHIGPRGTTTLSLLTAAIGAFLFGTEYYAAGFGVIAASAPAVHVGAMHCSNLFQQKFKILSHFSTAFQVSSFLFTIFSFFPTNLQTLFYLYALFLLFCSLSSWFIIHPAKGKYAIGDYIIGFTYRGVHLGHLDQVEARQDDIQDEYNTDTLKDKNVEDNLEVETNQKNNNETKSSALASAVLSREFFFFAVHKSAVLVALQFFVLTLESRLSGSNARAMNILFNSTGAFLGIFITGPIIGPRMDRDGAVTIFRWASGLVIFQLVLLMLSELFDFPILADIPSYLVWSAARITFFATFFALVVKIWGHAIFGTIVGLLSLIAAGVSISSSIPLSILAFEVKSGKAYGAGGIACVLLCTHFLCEASLLPTVGRIDSS